MGEYDPLCHLKAGLDFFEELVVLKELWVFENEYNRVSEQEGIAKLNIYSFMADWFRGSLDDKHPSDLNKIVLVPEKSGAGPYEAPVKSLNLPHRTNTIT